MMLMGADISRGLGVGPPLPFVAPVALFEVGVDPAGLDIVAVALLKIVCQDPPRWQPLPFGRFRLLTV